VWQTFSVCRAWDAANDSCRAEHQARLLVPEEIPLSFLSRLSFRKSLTLLAFVPLCAVLALGAAVSINA
jgi:hypothetical protein